MQVLAGFSTSSAPFQKPSSALYLKSEESSIWGGPEGCADEVGGPERAEPLHQALLFHITAHMSGLTYALGLESSILA
ncbi:hypothetical protein ACHAPV_009370 [Trichoderma viride]